ncbi:hypothetical protein NHX12_014041, partial [Muraenolepis orangiensis]
RHVFLKDKTREASCRHAEPMRRCQEAESQTLPSGAGLGQTLPPRGEMVENEIYGTGPPLGGRWSTRSYHLRHRPVPEIPPRPLFPPLDRTTPAALTSAPKLTAGPLGPSTPIAPYGEIFLYNNNDNSLGPQASVQTSTPPWTSAWPCASSPGENAHPPSGTLSSEGGPVRHPAVPSSDISPYACFYGAAAPPPVLRAGWLDKLSPHGSYVFQRRWVRFDGDGLAYYNNDKRLSRLLPTSLPIRHSLAVFSSIHVCAFNPSLASSSLSHSSCSSSPARRSTYLLQALATRDRQSLTSISLPGSSSLTRHSPTPPISLLPRTFLSRNDPIRPRLPPSRSAHLFTLTPTDLPLSSPVSPVPARLVHLGTSVVLNAIDSSPAFPPYSRRLSSG